MLMCVVGVIAAGSADSHVHATSPSCESPHPTLGWTRSFVLLPATLRSAVNNAEASSHVRGGRRVCFLAWVLLTRGAAALRAGAASIVARAQGCHTLFQAPSGMLDRSIVVASAICQHNCVMRPVCVACLRADRHAMADQPSATCKQARWHASAHSERHAERMACCACRTADQAHNELNHTPYTSGCLCPSCVQADTCSVPHSPATLRPTHIFPAPGGVSASIVRISLRQRRCR